MMREQLESSWQISEKRVPDCLWDVAIIGAGPAGSAAAIQLARLGHAVLLLERYRLPREKVCGDGLLPDALKHLAALGLADEVRSWGFPISAMRVFSPGGVEFEVPGDFLSLERAQLDWLMARRAAAVGVTVCRADVSRINPSGAGHTEIFLQGNSRPIRARYAVIATGAQVNLAAKLALVPQSKPTALAMRCYVRSKAEVVSPVLSYHKTIRPGYAWIFPLGDGKYNVGCGTLLTDRGAAGPVLRQVYRTFIESFPLAKEVMARSTDMTALKGAALRCGLPRADMCVGGSVIGIGETIGTTLPFTGEGVGKAMGSAILAAEVIHSALQANDERVLARYPLLLDRYLRPSFLGYEAAQRWLALPWLSDLVAKRIRRSPYLRQACGDIIRGTSNPRAVYSVSGVLRSLWS